MQRSKIFEIVPLKLEVGLHRILMAFVFGLLSLSFEPLHVHSKTAKFCASFVQMGGWGLNL